MFKKTDQKTWDDYWLPPEKLIENKPEGNDLPHENFPLLFKTVMKNATKLYSGGIKELKVTTKKIIGQYLEHDKSRKSRVPFPNIPNIANMEHQRYEVDVNWDVREIPLRGVSSTQYLLRLYDKFKQISVYFLVILSKDPPSIYEFQKNPDQKSYIFYPEPDWEFLFAITDVDSEKLGIRTLNNFIAWSVTQILEGNL